MVLDRGNDDPAMPGNDRQGECHISERGDVESGSETVQDSDSSTVPLPSFSFHTLADKVLNFLAEASSETLGACIVALCASTYFVLGRVGLVLIGAVGGIALRASWEYNGPNEGRDWAKATELKRRREVGLDIASRVLQWRHANASVGGDEAWVGSKDVGGPSETPDLELEGFQPLTKVALAGLTDAIIRDYIK